MVDDDGEKLTLDLMSPEFYERIQPRFFPRFFDQYKPQDYRVAEVYHLPEPHKKINEWLNSDNVKQSLRILYKKSFTEILQHGIFCILLYSSAVIQKKYEKRFLEDGYLFLKIATIVLRAIKCIHSEFEVNIHQLYEGFEYYCMPIENEHVRIKLPEKKKYEMTRDYNALLSEKLIEVTINACDYLYLFATQYVQKSTM